MSSYLNLYGVPKLSEEEEKTNKEPQPICFASFSRNDEVYRHFDENVDIAFCFNETKYTEINDCDIDKIENDINTMIRHSEKRLAEYEKYAAKNEEYIQEILNTKEYIEELYRDLHYIEFIGRIVYEASYKYRGGFCKILANIT